MNEVRGRLTERLTRARVRLEARRAAKPLVIVVIGGVISALGAAFVFTSIDRTAFSKTYTARFEVNDAFGIVPGLSDVRFRGIPAGRVTALERHGSQVVIKAKIKREYGPIYRDARAQLRPVTPLEDVYLDVVNPGTPAAGTVTADRPIPGSATEVAVRVDDVLDTFKANERRRLQALLDQLGNGLADNGAALRRSFVELTHFLVSANRVTGELAARRRQTKRLVHNMALLTTELRRRQQALRTLVTAGSATLGTLQQSSPDLDATLHQLPGTVDAISASMATLRPVLEDVDPAVRALYPAASQLDASLASLRRLAADLEPAARDLQHPVRRLEPLAVAARPVAERLKTVAAGLVPRLPTVHKVSQDMVKCETGFIGFFQWNVSMSKFGDLHGADPRGSLGFAVPNTGAGIGTRVGAPSCVGGLPAGGRPVNTEDFK